MRTMKKLLLALAGAGLLASCNTVSTGGGSATVEQIRTEYRLGSPSGPFVACDQVNGVDAATQVKVYFTASGTVDSVDIALIGNTDNRYDGNYTARATGAQLASLGGNRFTVAFDANPGTGLLPQAIVVNPVARTVKVVNATTQKAGSFRADLTLNTPNGSGTATSQFLGDAGNIGVYQGCSLVTTTNENI